MAEPNPPGNLRLLVTVGLLSALTAGIGVTAVKRSQSEPEPEPERNWDAASSPSVAPVVPQTVDVLVAAKDLPVGTVMDKDTVAAAVARKAVPRGELPPKYLGTPDALLGKLLSRAMRAGDVFHPDDLLKASAPLIPPGQNMISAAIGCPVARSGVVVPGDRVDVLAAVKVGDAVKVVTVLADQLVLAASNDPPHLPMYSFAVDRKQALVLELAKARAGVLSLSPRDAKAARGAAHDTDAVMAFLAEMPDTDPPAAAKPAAVPPPAAPAVPFVLPKGTQAVAIDFPPAGANPFIGPGARIDLLATATFDKKLTAFPVVVGVLVIAVDTQSAPGRPVARLTVTFAVDKEQAAVIALAQAKKCPLMMLLPGPGGDTDGGYDIKKVAEALTTLAVPEPAVAPAPRAK